MPFYNTRGAASTAQYLAATAGTLLTADAVWAAGAQVPVTFGTTITLDFATGLNFSLTATGNFTLNNPTNLKPGQTGRILITQDGTGGRTIAYGSYFKKAAADSNALSTAANAVDILYYDVVSPTFIKITLAKAVA